MKEPENLNIWIVKEGEPLPIESHSGRLMRAGMLADIFSSKGATITWWSSTYLHYEKKYISNCEKSISIKHNLHLNLLHSNNGYKKNISNKRIKYSHDLGNRFRILSKDLPVPDVIYCAYPLIDFSYESVRYGKEHNVPVVIDIRDFWPDIFIQPIPRNLHKIAHFCINLLFGKKVSFIMVNADVVVGVIPKVLKFAESYGRILKPNDHIVKLAYDNSPETKEAILEAENFWKMHGLSEKQCIISYIGTINNRIGDFSTLVEAAEICVDPSIVFVLCGTGNYLAELIERCKHLKNVVLPGYRNRAEIQSLLKLSTFGLLAYRNTDDFIDAIPNKFGEYLSQGLIILTSLKGASRHILENELCGKYYNNAKTLLECVAQIKSSSSLKKRMSQNALNLFHREFDASQVYYNFYRFLEAIAIASKKNRGKTSNYEQI